MKVACIVPSAGKGKRLGQKQDKAFVPLGGRPLLTHTLRALSACSLITDIIVVVSEGSLPYCAQLVRRYGLRKVKDIVKGGRKRFDSVKAGLKRIKDADIILIHDGARPFVDEATIKGIIMAARRYGAAVPLVPSRQTLKVVDEGLFVTKTPDRKNVLEAQTPQGFRSYIIVDAYLHARNNTYTDDASIVERTGHKVKGVKGSYRNIKITTPEDLVLAERLIKCRH